MISVRVRRPTVELEGRNVVVPDVRFWTYEMAGRPAGEFRFRLFDGTHCVEWSQYPLEFAARELNAGRAYVASHEPVGCRVQPFAVGRRV